MQQPITFNYLEHDVNETIGFEIVPHAIMYIIRKYTDKLIE